ncbi:MAG: hypothetical protein GWN00_23730, partial [Aliifodinibius sp.]|nr:hypothetical protein [Fodinibius sp.]NIY27704.1 hypothetical protein [Fodinibius sp.]
MLKRTIDILVALLGLVLFLPFFPWVWLLVKLSFKASVFVKDDRVGRDGKPVRLYRFRVPNGGLPGSKAEETRHRPSLAGRLFRALRLDGWPLLFNVLKGELSLVGPLPEKSEFVRDYSEEQKQVLCVRPGIWGPYQRFDSNGKNGLDGESSTWEEYYRHHVLPEKLKVELKYVQNRFLGKDVKVLIALVVKKITRTIHDQLMREAKDRNFFLPLDLFLIFFSYFIAYQLRFEWSVPTQEYFIFLKTLPLLVVLRVATLYYCGLYKNLWKYVGVKDLVSIINSCTISTLLLVAGIFLLGISSHSRSILLIDWLLCISFIGGSRLMLRMFDETYRVEKILRQNVLIIGAGDVGEMLLRELDKNGRNKYNVIGFIDDDEDKHGRTIHGVKVLGSCEDIPEIAPLLRIDDVLITGNQFSSEEMKAILSYCSQAGVRHRMVPAVSDLLSGAVHLSRFRKV